MVLRSGSSIAATRGYRFVVVLFYRFFSPCGRTTKDKNVGSSRRIGRYELATTKDSGCNGGFSLFRDGVCAVGNADGV